MAPAKAALRRDDLAIVLPAIDDREPEPLRPVAALRAATISTTDGDVISHGVAELRGTAVAWSATMTRLDQPGAVAIAYFAEGVRSVVLSLNDGRGGRARLIGTRFAAGSERVCELEGLEPLAHITAA
ncbi:MAG TPA: hypothetical protein VFY79_07835 [Dehalococcoidia bacterium]|nr:hypothetical protein [Dehalococcoidia bacterium]